MGRHKAENKRKYRKKRKYMKKIQKKSNMLHTGNRICNCGELPASGTSETIVSGTFCRLSHSTVELSKVSQLLLAVEKGEVNKWKGKSLSEISVEDLLEYTADYDDETERKDDDDNEDERKDDDNDEAERKDDDDDEAERKDDEANNAEEKDDEANNAEGKDDEANNAEGKDDEANNAEGKDDEAIDAEGKDDEANNAEGKDDDDDEVERKDDAANNAEGKDDDKVERKDDEANNAEGNDDDVPKGKPDDDEDHAKAPNTRTAANPMEVQSRGRLIGRHRALDRVKEDEEEDCEDSDQEEQKKQRGRGRIARHRCIIESSQEDISPHRSHQKKQRGQDSSDDSSQCKNEKSQPRKRGLKRRWSASEHDILKQTFQVFIDDGVMPPGSMIESSVITKLKDRTVAQLRTKLYNIINKKQKFL